MKMILWIFHVMSGQSARLSLAHVPSFAWSCVRCRNKTGEGIRVGGGGGGGLHWRVQGSTSSPTGIGSCRKVFWGVMEFGMSRRIKPKEKYVRISMKEIWRNLDGPSKNKELWSYVVSYEFSRPEVAQTGPSRCWVVSLGCQYEPCFIAITLIRVRACVCVRVC